MALKRCTKCQQSKPLTHFSKHGETRDGRDPHCKECSSMENKLYYVNHKSQRAAYGKTYRRANKKKIAERNKAWRLRNRERLRKYQREWQRRHKGRTHWYATKNRYGVTEKDFNAMFSEQAGVCAICAKPDTTRLSIDHCHKAQRVRGLLCRKCNLSIGHIHDSTEMIFRMLNYLLSRKAKEDYCI